MTLTTKQRRLLDDLVLKAPPKLKPFFGRTELEAEEHGACVTYSRMLAEVLGEFGISAEVKPVFIITANQLAIDIREGRISQEEGIKQGARFQYWGDIREGQEYQHAVCHIPNWEVVIDLAMERRASRQVPCHPYWIAKGHGPWWLQRLHFMGYPLESRGYDLYPEDVAKGKEIIRNMVKKYYRRQKCYRK